MLDSAREYRHERAREDRVVLRAGGQHHGGVVELGDGDPHRDDLVVVSDCQLERRRSSERDRNPVTQPLVRQRDTRVGDTRARKGRGQQQRAALGHDRNRQVTRKHTLDHRGGRLRRGHHLRDEAGFGRGDTHRELGAEVGSHERIGGCGGPGDHNAVAEPDIGQRGRHRTCGRGVRQRTRRDGQPDPKRADDSECAGRGHGVVRRRRGQHYRGVVQLRHGYSCRDGFADVRDRQLEGRRRRQRDRDAVTQPLVGTCHTGIGDTATRQRGGQQRGRVRRDDRNRQVTREHALDDRGGRQRRGQHVRKESGLGRSHAHRDLRSEVRRHEGVNRRGGTSDEYTVAVPDVGQHWRDRTVARRVSKSAGRQGQTNLQGSHHRERSNSRHRVVRSRRGKHRRVVVQLGHGDARRDRLVVVSDRQLEGRRGGQRDRDAIAQPLVGQGDAGIGHAGSRKRRGQHQRRRVLRHNRNRQVTGEHALDHRGRCLRRRHDARDEAGLGGGNSHRQFRRKVRGNDRVCRRGCAGNHYTVAVPDVRQRRRDRPLRRRVRKRAR